MISVDLVSFIYSGIPSSINKLVSLGRIYVIYYLMYYAIIKMYYFVVLNKMYRSVDLYSITLVKRVEVNI